MSAANGGPPNDPAVRRKLAKLRERRVRIEASLQDGDERDVYSMILSTAALAEEIGSDVSEMSRRHLRLRQDFEALRLHTDALTRRVNDLEAEAMGRASGPLH